MLDDGDTFKSMTHFIASLRQKTGTDRSDADLKALVTKKAAVRGIALDSEQADDLA